MIRLLGALLIIFGCGGVGFSMAAAHRKEEKSLRQLISALDFMQCELQYHLTALPVLCSLTAAQCTEPLHSLFHNLSAELENQISPDVYHCMIAALHNVPNMTPQTKSLLIVLGKTLGCFDLEGQLVGLENVRQNCRSMLEKMSLDRDVRLRSYQTLGLCAGAALAIIFL